MALNIKYNAIEPTDNAVGYDASFGTFSSSAAVAGNKIDSTKTKKVDICADDGGANFGSTAVRALRARTLLTTAQSGSASISGVLGQIKSNIADTTTGFKNGVWGYAETGTSATVADRTSGIRATLDVPSGATIASSAVVAAIVLDSITLGGTHTGKAAAISIPNPGSGTWDYLAIFGTASGACVANTAYGTGQLAAIAKCRFGSTDCYIPLLAAVPS